MTRNITFQKSIFLFIAILFSLKVFSQEYNEYAPFLIYKNYVVIDTDTVNRYNEFLEKDGFWIKYVLNFNCGTEKYSTYYDTVTLSSNCTVEWIHLSEKDSIFSVYQILILEYQYYNNGQKVGVWNGFYPRGEKHYDAVFSNNHLKKVFIYQKHSGKKMKFIKKKGKGIYFAKRLNTWEKITEEEVNKMFGWE